MSPRGSTHNRKAPSGVAPNNQKKQRLRTAAEVLARLKWSSIDATPTCTSSNDDDDDNHHNSSSSNILMGYDDRIQGPMEKNIIEYKSIQQGGDFPEHRIWYFRKSSTCSRQVQNLSDEDLSSLILWDRLGRVDRLFRASGDETAAVAVETLQHVRRACQTMKRLEKEQEEKRKQRQKEKQRRSQKRAARAMAMDSKSAATSPGCSPFTTTSTPVGRPLTRYNWHPADWYEYSVDTQSWQPGTAASAGRSAEKKNDDDGITVVTWNVLFDLYHRNDESVAMGMNAQEKTSERSATTETDQQRWLEIVRILSESNAGIIALQEVTPTFCDLLCAQQWVRQDYSSTATACHSSTVSPSGNLVMWNKSRLVPISLSMDKKSVWTCVDGVKRRGTIVALQQAQEGKKAVVWLVANAHLLADPHQKSAAMARKRELASAIGQLQKLESAIHRDQPRRATAVVPMILGDFNATEDPDELADGCFSGKAVVGSVPCRGFFVDTWPCLSLCSDTHTYNAGHTFDPRTNARAAQSRSLVGKVDNDTPKRNDRIYIAASTCSQPDLSPVVLPVGGDLLGCVSQRDPNNYPPSDHYGVRMSFSTRLDMKQRPSLYDPRILYQNAWAANAMSTPDTLLGLVLGGNGRLGDVDLFDPSSTLPIPHVTLLHGFVELNSSNSRALALQACQNAVSTAFADETTLGHAHNLRFLPSSLDVFAHASSATLIALPDIECPQGAWLRRLYECLTKTFRHCHCQESRFAEGWIPHISLGTFGTSNAARDSLASIRRDKRWIQEPCDIPAHALTLFQRDLSNGKIYAIASVPLVPRRFIPQPTSATTTPKMYDVSIRSFLYDMGESWSSYFCGLSDAVILEVERSSRETAMELGYGDARLHVYGSQSLNVSLPEISDVDAVLCLHPPESNQKQSSVPCISTRRFLNDLSSCLVAHHSSAKTRFRNAGTGSCSLDILTIKLWASAPSVDILVCVLGKSGRPLDTTSQVSIAYHSMKDTIMILDFIRSAAREANLDEANVVRIYQGTLRLIKLWAYRRNVYGANAGYLGGGGWAVCLARGLMDGIRSGRLTLHGTDDEMSKLSLRLAKFFFEQTCNWIAPLIVTLESSQKHSGTAQTDIQTATLRNSMAVLAPCSEGNHGRNSTRTTLHTTLVALKNAAGALRSFSKEGTSTALWVDLLRYSTLEEDLAPFSDVIVVAVSFDQPLVSQSTTIVAKLKAWGSARTLNLVVKLEKKLSNEHDPRFFPRPCKQKDDDGRSSFFWMIGLRSSPAEAFALTGENEKLDVLLVDEENAWCSELAESFASLSSKASLKFLSVESALRDLRRSKST